MRRQLYLGEDLIATSELIDSGSIGEFKTAPFLLPNFALADGTTEYDKNNTYKTLYEVLSQNASNLLLEGSDENHFRILDLSGRYVKLSTNGKGEIGNESLPNIKGATDRRGARFGWYSSDLCEGAIDKGPNGPTRECSGGDTSHNGIQLFFDASKGQTDGAGGYVAQSESTYKDGAKVNPDHVLMMPQFRYRNDKAEISVLQQMLDLAHPVGSHFTQYGSSDNPNELFNDSGKTISSTWTLVETSESYLQYDSTAYAGTIVAEELPNIKGEFVPWAYQYAAQPKGAFAQTGANLNSFASGDNHQGLKVLFDAATGQANADGTYKPQADSTYKDGGKVHPKGFTVRLWRRVT